MIGLGDPRHWRLKGQGSANAVFAYTGNIRELECHVLRIPKITYLNSATLDALQYLENLIWSPALSSSISGAAERQAAYEEAVLRPLLGSQFIHRGHLCQLRPAFADSLSAKLAGACNGLSCQAWLLSDHTLFKPSPERGSLCADSSDQQSDCSNISAEQERDACSTAWEAADGEETGTLCVEIKPKCGFLPTSPLIRPEHNIKRRVPRFQLHQLLKLEQGKIQRLSAYNPLDLFSGRPQQMEAALAALFEEPQNNLRLFAGGAAVQLQQDGKLRIIPIFQQFGGVSGLIRLLRIILLREGVLDRILAVQKMDVHDIEGIHPLLAALQQKQAPKAPSDDSLECSQDGTSASDKVAGAHADAAPPPGQFRPAHGAQEVCGADLARLLSADWPTATAALQDYLTATTAKDCSLMITLVPLQYGPAAEHNGTPNQESCAHGMDGRKAGRTLHISGEQLPMVQENPEVGSIVEDREMGRWAKYKVAVVDLDLKPLRKIMQHSVLDQQILDCALRTGLSVT